MNQQHEGVMFPYISHCLHDVQFMTMTNWEFEINNYRAQASLQWSNKFFAPNKIIKTSEGVNACVMKCLGLL